MGSKIKWVFSRTAVLVAIFMALAHITVDFSRIRLKVLNDTQPAFKDMVDFMQHPSRQKAHMIKPYARYYKLAVRYLPKGPTAYAMAGYTQYYLGNTQRALDLMRSATEMAPRCFWFYYNVGIIYFNKRQYAQATAYLQQALSMHIDESINTLLLTKIYHDLLAVAVTQGVDPTVSLQRGYEQAKLILAQAWMGNPDQKSYELQIF